MTITVEGRRLEMSITGQGTPAVVLESGFGLALESWQQVCSRVSKFARVVCYNRPGIRQSEPVATPRTAENIARELHVALLAADVEPPYILVGHAVGAFYVRVFAHRFPRDTGGLVFLEPVPDDFYQWMRTHKPDLWGQMEQVARQLPEPLQRELAGKEESADQARNAWPLPEVAKIVLTATRQISPLFPSDVLQAWLQQQEDFARSLPADQYVTTDQSGHNIQIEKPELVTEAIRQAIADGKTSAGNGA
jgi:pimeloyl-ACP methyl ester carboxylesterase